MFYNQCGQCGERWEIGTARTCKCEATPVQEPVAMRQVLVKIARFLDVVRVYAQDIQPKNELETDKPLHWKARELQDEVIRLLDTTPPAQPAAQTDIADIIAGELKVSRGTAYDLMREALKQTEQPAAWVGLTNEEREAILDREFRQWWSRHDAVCRAIEAKLKEKNT